jgi:hypothetical protein
MIKRTCTIVSYFLINFISLYTQYIKNHVHRIYSHKIFLDPMLGCFSIAIFSLDYYVKNVLPLFQNRQ